MITTFLIGIAIAITISNAPKFVKVRRLLFSTDSRKEVCKWVSLENQSFCYLAGVAVAVMVIDIIGAFSVNALWVEGDFIAGANAVIVLGLVECIFLVIGFTVAAIYGSRARKVLRTKNIQSPIERPIRSRVFLFIVGWLTYFGFASGFLGVVTCPY